MKSIKIIYIYSNTIIKSFICKIFLLHDLLKLKIYLCLYFIQIKQQIYIELAHKTKKFIKKNINKNFNSRIAVLRTIIT